MVALCQSDVDRFMAALPEALPGDADGWRKRRDAAMQALALGAGVKVAEVIGMYIENIGELDKDGYMTVQISPAASDGASEWHDTRLEPMAVPVVLAWVAERNRMTIPGKLLFPATLSGKRMDKSTFYLAVKATFERAGLEVRHQGGRTLRNTFAVRALRRGVSCEDVNSCLGLRQPKSIEQYQYAAITQAAHERAFSGSVLAA
jgi:integrase/recombinase XerD